MTSPFDSLRGSRYFISNLGVVSPLGRAAEDCWVAEDDAFCFRRTDIGSLLTHFCFTNTGYLEHWDSPSSLIATYAVKTMYTNEGMALVLKNLIGNDVDDGGTPSARYLGFITGACSFAITDTLATKTWTENLNVSRQSISSSLSTGPPPWTYLLGTELHTVYCNTVFPSLTGMFVAANNDPNGGGPLLCLILPSTPITYTTYTTTEGSFVRAGYVALRMTCLTTTTTVIQTDLKVTNQGLRAALYGAWWDFTLANSRPSDGAKRVASDRTYVSLISPTGFTSVSSQDILGSHSGWTETPLQFNYALSRSQVTVATISTNTAFQTAFVDQIYSQRLTPKGVFLAGQGAVANGLVIASTDITSVYTITPGDEFRFTGFRFKLTDLSSV